jgi:integrase
MRQGELLGLAWSDVDLDGGRLLVRRQLQRQGGKAVRVPLKTEQSRRELLLPEPVLESLRAHRAAQAAEQLQAEAWLDRWQLVFTTEFGEPLEATAVLRLFQGHLRAAGLPVVRFHDLRHTAATLLAESGVHVKVAQAILGHSNVSTTLDIYTHAAVDQQRDAFAAMGRKLTGS